MSVFAMAFTDENVVEPDIGRQWKEVPVGHARNEVQRTTTEDGTSSSGCVSQDSTHRYCLGLCLLSLLLLQLVTAPHMPGDKIHHMSKFEKHSTNISDSTKASKHKRHESSNVSRPVLCTENSIVIRKRHVLSAPSCTIINRNKSTEATSVIANSKMCKDTPCLRHRWVSSKVNNAKGRFSARNVLGFSQIECV